MLTCLACVAAGWLVTSAAVGLAWSRATRRLNQ